MISRRNFLQSSVALTALAELPFAAAGATHQARQLRLGVLADLHVKGEDSTGTFEKALRFFDAQKADGVVCAGDLATSGLSSELERVARAWFRVFPDNRRSDGGAVEKLFIYGDHDMGGYAWKESRGLLSEAELQAQIIPTHDPKAIWERCFREPWEPVQVKEIKGFAFFLAHHPPHNEATAQGNYIPGVASVLAAHAAKLEGRPFFYIQHRPIPGLADEKTIWRKGDPRMAATLRRYSSCIALTGHTHRSCTDEELLWQGDFTALNVPCLRYLGLRPGRENSRAWNPAENADLLMEALAPRDGQQAYLLDVTEREIVVRRLDFAYSTGAAVASPWRIPLPVLGEGSAAWAARAAAEGAPRFQPDARMRVRAAQGKDRAGKTRSTLVVAFPPAFSTPTTPRAFDYEVIAEGAKGRIVKRVFSMKCYLPEELDAGHVECVFAHEAVGEGPVRIDVFPCGCFGVKGVPLSCLWKG